MPIGGAVTGGRPAQRSASLCSLDKARTIPHSQHMGETTTEGKSGSKCRLCGCRLRATEHLVRLSGELFHVSCAEPALRDSSAWREREVGTLNQLVAGIGRATVV